MASPECLKRKPATRPAPRRNPMPRDFPASRRDLLKAGAGLAAFGLALGPRPARAAREMTTREKELYAAAKQEGSLTWNRAHSHDVTAQALGSESEARYPGIKVSVV